jgi:predicted  nucleic acid-binding Zn-ribbon protein
LRQLADLRRQITEAESDQRRLASEAQTLEREQARLVNLIVQLGDDSAANRDRRARVDAIDAEITRAQGASAEAAARITDLRRQIAALIGA